MAIAVALAQATMRWTTPDKGALLHVRGEEAPGTLAETLTGRASMCGPVCFMPFMPRPPCRPMPKPR